MNGKYYIDTCSLKWRYLLGKPTGDVNSLVQTATNDVFISELTILEWSSALAGAVRDSAIDFSIFKKNEVALFTDIASKNLKIFTIRRMLERARYWVEYVGVLNKRGLKTNDAIHLTAAIELSGQLGESVVFVTSDKRLSRIIDDFDVFRPQLTSQYLDPA